jgi:hypothetical protein
MNLLNNNPTSPHKYVDLIVKALAINKMVG